MDSSITDVPSSSLELNEEHYSSLSRNSCDLNFGGTLMSSGEDMTREPVNDEFDLDLGLKNRIDSSSFLDHSASSSYSMDCGNYEDLKSCTSSVEPPLATATLPSVQEVPVDKVTVNSKVKEDLKMESTENNSDGTVTTLEETQEDKHSAIRFSINHFNSDSNHHPPQNSTALDIFGPTVKYAEFHQEVKMEVDVVSTVIEFPPEALIEETVTCEVSKVVKKLDISSEEDEGNFDHSRKSGTESLSSKDGSPSQPSCSGTSRTGINSLSSDSEDDLPSIDISLPFKKRKRMTPVTLSSSSCSEDESHTEIDYANLTPEEIKALIEEAKRYGSIKRCQCPKKKLAELPVKGPTETSGKCNIGKGDWREKVPCAACSAGVCTESNHKRGRRPKRRVPNPRSLLAKSRARGTIGQDVPIIELSDSEDPNPLPSRVNSEVTISAVPSGECIVLSSSSDDDDDIVCEGVIKTEVKTQATGSEGSKLDVPSKGGSPDVVVLNTSSAASYPSIPPVSHVPHPDTTVFPIIPAAQPVSQPPQHPGPAVSDAWPDFNFELENWDETLNLLNNIYNMPQNAESVLLNGSRVNPAAVPERPSSPEGWSCPICLESKTAVIEIMSTTCGHVFCGNCIRSAVKLHKKCPTCRKKLTMKQFHKIFL